MSYKPMLSFILFFICIYFLLWLLPRLWWFFRTVYLLKSKIEKGVHPSDFTHRRASSFHAKAERAPPQKIEKDISDRVKIIE